MVTCSVIATQKSMKQKIKWVVTPPLFDWLSGTFLFRVKTDLRNLFSCVMFVFKLHVLYHWNLIFLGSNVTPLNVFGVYCYLFIISFFIPVESLMSVCSSECLSTCWSICSRNFNSVFFFFETVWARSCKVCMITSCEIYTFFFYQFEYFDVISGSHGVGKVKLQVFLFQSH